MMIYKEIKKLISKGIDRHGLKKKFEKMATFNRPLLEEYVKQNDYDKILIYHDNMVYSYEVTPMPAKFKDALFLTVNVMTYDEHKKGIHLFHSFECDMKNHPDDLENIVSYLDRTGYHEIAPVEFFDLQFHVKCIDPKWFKSVVSGNYEDVNVNVVAGIPNKTNGYVPNEHDQDSPVPDNTPEYDEER